eukprot:scaffold11272_cov201-Alexandrium_tamarense.AAC.4
MSSSVEVSVDSLSVQAFDCSDCIGLCVRVDGGSDSESFVEDEMPRRDRGASRRKQQQQQHSQREQRREQPPSSVQRQCSSGKSSTQLSHRLSKAVQEAVREAVNEARDDNEEEAYDIFWPSLLTEGGGLCTVMTTACGHPNFLGKVLVCNKMNNDDVSVLTTPKDLMSLDDVDADYENMVSSTPGNQHQQLPMSPSLPTKSSRSLLKSPSLKSVPTLNSLPLLTRSLSFKRTGSFFGKKKYDDGRKKVIVDGTKILLRRLISNQTRQNQYYGQSSPLPNVVFITAVRSSQHKNEVLSRHRRHHRREY